MQKFFDNVVDKNGHVLAGASVTVTDAATGALSTIYSNNSLGIKANPITCDSNGYFEFYAANGRYNIDVAGTGLQTRHVTDVLLEDITGTGADLVGFTPAGTGAVVRTSQNKMRDIVSVKDFGAVGDGVTDDTAAVQAWVNYLTTNHIHGFVPAGTYKLTSKINFPETFGWGIRGVGQTAAIFKMATDNVPIFDLGVTVSSSMHSYVITDIGFDYTNSQPSTNTSANPIKFSAMGFEGVLDRLTFSKGSWAIKVASGIGGPWGQHWDNLNFNNGLTGGAMDWTGAINGVPNNHFGRMLVTATNMAGPIFKQIKGYNWVWDNLELLDGHNCQWMDVQAGSQLHLRAVKMELCDYSGTPGFSGVALMNFPSGQVRIGQLFLGGTTATFAFATTHSVLNVTTGEAAVDMLVTGVTSAPTNFYVIAAGAGDSKINYPLSQRGTNPVDFSNVGGSVSADFVTFLPEKNDRMSANKGDGDYTIAGGDPATIRYETALTAIRTVNLPASNNCFNGLRYRVESAGAVNGANTILVKSAGNLKATLGTDKTFVELMWRRNPTAHAGWAVVGSGTLP